MAEAFVTRVEFDDDGLCRAYSGTALVSEFQTVYEVAFNAQYDTPLSPDGRCLFVGTWSRGLFCYDAVRGDLLWAKGPGKVRRMVVTTKLLIAEMCDRGIYKRDLTTGDLIDEIKMSAIEFMLQISEDEIFAGPKRNQYFIFAIPTLTEKYRIPRSTLDLNDCLSFVIGEADKVEDQLLVRGYEEYPHGDYLRKGATPFERSVRLG